MVRIAPIDRCPRHICALQWEKAIWDIFILDKSRLKDGLNYSSVIAYALPSDSKKYYQAEVRRFAMAFGKQYSKTFRARFDDNGKRFGKEKDARRYISKLLTEADQWEDQLHEMNPLTRTKKKEDTTLWELWDVYRTLKLPKTCPNNQKLMNRAIRYCEEYYDIPWTKMEVVDFQRIIDKVTNTYDCRRKVKNLLSGLSAIAVSRGITDYNRVAPVELPKRPHYKKDFYSEREVKELYDRYYARNDYKPLCGKDKMACAEILILCTTGMRPGELRNVKAENIDFNHLLIRDAGIKTDTSRERLIPFISDMEEIIRDYCTPINQFAQYSETTLRVHIQKFLQSIGMRYRVPSAGRKTFSTTNALHNIQPEVNQQALGHVPGSKVTEEHYIERGAEYVQHQIEKVFNLSEERRSAEAQVEFLWNIVSNKYDAKTLAEILEAICKMESHPTEAKLFVV